MKGKVIKFCDPAGIPVPAGLLTATVDPRQVEQDVQRLALRYAQRVSVRTVQPGDTVYCRADGERYPDGRTVLLHTGLGVPGAEEAGQAALGKAVGEMFSAPLAGKPACLTVEQILRPLPAEVNDALIAGLGLEGVTTVEGYRAFVAQKMLSDKKTENKKMAVGHVMSQMLSQSAFDYDEEEFSSFFAANQEAILADYRSMGMEIEVSELRAGMLEQEKQGWLAQEYCRRNDIHIDLESAQADADQMMEMMQLMGEPVPDREQLVEEAIRNSYVTALFQGLEDLVANKMGGSENGNN